MQKPSPANFTLYPLLWLSICFTAGIVAAKYLGIDWKIFLAGTLICGGLTALFLNRGPVILLALGFIFLGGLSFAARYQFTSPDRVKVLFDTGQINTGDPVEVEGILAGKPESGVGGYFLTLETRKMLFKGAERPVAGNVHYFAPWRNDAIKQEYDALDLSYGARVRIAANLRRDEAFLNPGVTSRIELLGQQETDASAVIESPLLIEKLGDEPVFPPRAWVYEQRQNLIDEFSAKFSVSTAGIMNASLLGDRHYLDRPTADIFREGGTFHVLVISGLHVTFIGGIVVFFLRVFTKRRWLQFISANIFLWGYTLAVGADLPVARAAIMFTILLFSHLVMRQGTLLNSFGACGLILLVWRPADLFTASFQLTFMSVGAIVACAFPIVEKLRQIGRWTPTAPHPLPPRVPRLLKRLCEMFYWREEAWKIDRKRNVWSAGLFKSPYLKWLEPKGLQVIAAYIFEGVLISIIVQIWLLPLLVVYFHRFTFVSVLLNLWVGFFLALESFSAVIGVMFAQINGALALPLIKLAEAFNWLLLSVPRLFTYGEWSSVRPADYSGTFRAVYFVYFIPVILLAVAANNWNPFSFARRNEPVARTGAGWAAVKISGGLLLLFTVLVIFHPFSAPRPDGKLHLDFLDVGQGDSTLVTFPDGRTLLIDGGGEASRKRMVQREGEEPEVFEPDSVRVGEAVVSQFLWNRGYSKIDYVLATHADTDHMQGITDIVKNFRVKYALLARAPAKDPDYIELSAALQSRSVPVVNISRGDVLDFDGVKIEVLSPEADASPDADWDNNHSIVLRISFGERSFLMTGDIEGPAEDALLADPASLKSDVVKVAHHGSHTSSTPGFIAATGARYAIIPVGRRSRFGHPDKNVVERWINSGAKVMKTGEKGTISIVTDGKELEIKTFLP